MVVLTMSMSAMSVQVPDWRKFSVAAATQGLSGRFCDLPPDLLQSCLPGTPGHHVGHLPGQPGLQAAHAKGRLRLTSHAVPPGLAGHRVPPVPLPLLAHALAYGDVVLSGHGLARSHHASSVRRSPVDVLLPHRLAHLVSEE